MDFRIFCAMDVGPRDNQEDSILLQGEIIQERRFEESRKFSTDTVEILAVCDGMGGLAAGEKASRFVCESLAKLGGSSSLIEDIRPSLEKIQLAMENDYQEECGTTVAGLISAPGGIQVFNLGDSRVYRVSAGKIECRSCDHSMVQSLLEEGKITEREAFEHPYRNLITAGMGPVFSYKWALETIHLQAEPLETGPVVYLICSDGVCDVLTGREILEALGDNPVANGPALMAHIKAVSMKDNTSFMVVEINP
ncbi:MAG: serine/threonine-protein phosphatase [Desulfobacterales bacterium]|nr:serine/threonine-protein phosphatase [Desulfobacterales bacterium]